MFGPYVSSFVTAILQGCVFAGVPSCKDLHSYLGVNPVQNEPVYQLSYRTFEMTVIAPFRIFFFYVLAIHDHLSVSVHRNFCSWNPHVKCQPCQHSMARLQVVGGGDGLQGVDGSFKCTSSLLVGHGGLTTHHHRNSHHVSKWKQSSGLLCRVVC